jgi:hypothetical protein
LSDELNRRQFVGRGASLAGALALSAAGANAARSDDAKPAPQAGIPPGARPAQGEGLPRRVLGRTGLEITVLGLGTAPMGEGPPPVEECAKVFAEAIDLGIGYVDTARIYNKAEDALREVLRTRRDRVVLATKCMCDVREKAEESFEESLKRLGVPSVDILHLHSTGDRDLDRVLAPGGVWDYFREMKKAGKTRFLGITGHNRPLKFVRMLETGEVDVMMVAMNFADRYTYGFEDKVLPVARKHGTGVLAMKVYGGIRGGFAYVRQRRPSQMDEAYLQNAVRYALEIEGVSGLVMGVHDSEELRQNVAFVKAYTPLSSRERAALERHGRRLAEEWGPRWGSVEA